MSLSDKTMDISSSPGNSNVFPRHKSEPLKSAPSAALLQHPGSLLDDNTNEFAHVQTKSDKSKVENKIVISRATISNDTEDVPGVKFEEMEASVVGVDSANQVDPAEAETALHETPPKPEDAGASRVESGCNNLPELHKSFFPITYKNSEIWLDMKHNPYKATAGFDNPLPKPVPVTKLLHEDLFPQNKPNYSDVHDRLRPIYKPLIQLVGLRIPSDGTDPHLVNIGVDIHPIKGDPAPFPYFGLRNYYIHNKHGGNYDNNIGFKDIRYRPNESQPKIFDYRLFYWKGNDLDQNFHGLSLVKGLYCFGDMFLIRFAHEGKEKLWLNIEPQALTWPIWKVGTREFRNEGVYFTEDLTKSK